MQWKLPFHEVLDYTKFAVIIKEKELNQTAAILSAIPTQKRCEMRRETLPIYQQHFSTFPRQV